GVTVSPTARRKNPRRDSNPRFRAENPASLPLDHGGMKVIGGPGIEPGPARYQRAVPPRTPTSDEKGSGGRARTCSSRLTVARRTRSTSPEREAEGEGVEPSTAEAAPVFETGYRAGGSPSVSFKSSGPGRSRTCTVPIKSRQLCAFELRSREVWPAG